MRYPALVSRISSDDGASRRSLTLSDTDGTTRFRGDGGSLLVECAFVLPVFFIFVFLVIEGALLFSDWQSLNNALLAASRTATVYGNDSMADYQTVVAFKNELNGMPLSQVEGFVIFKPSPNAALGTMNNGCKTASIAGVCNFYSKNDINLVPSSPSTLYFSGCTDSTGTSGSKLDRYWCPVNRKVAVTGTNGPPDYIGVWAKIRHLQPTRMFGNSRDIEQTIVIKAEAQELV